MWGGERTASAILELYAPAEDGGMPLAFRNTRDIRLDRLLGLAERYHEPQSGPSTTGSRRRTSKAAGDDPLPYPENDEILRVVLDDDTIRRAFEEDPKLVTGTDYTPSVFSIKIANRLVKLQPDMSDEAVMRVVATYRARYAKNGQGAQYKPLEWYVGNVARACKWVAEEREKEAASSATLHAQADAEDLGDEPVLSKERLRELSKQDPLLEAAIMHTKRGPRKSQSDTDHEIAERTTNTGGSPREAVGAIKRQYEIHTDLPTPDDEDIAQTVRAVVKAKPISDADIDAATNLGELLNIPNIRIGRVADSTTRGVPTYVSIVEENGVERTHTMGTRPALGIARNFRYAVYDIYGVWLEPMKPRVHDKLMHMVMNSAELIDVGHPLYPGDKDDAEDFNNILEEYFMDFNARELSAEEAPNYGRSGTEAQGPFIFEKRRALFLSHFSRWVSSKSDSGLKRQAVIKALRSANWGYRRDYIAQDNRQRFWLESTGRAAEEAVFGTL